MVLCVYFIYIYIYIYIYNIYVLYVCCPLGASAHHVHYLQLGRLHAATKIMVGRQRASRAKTHMQNWADYTYI